MTGHVVDSASDPVGAVAAAAAELRAGRPVVLPTDTVYGVAALVGDASAMADIFERKGRDAAKPMAVLVADANQASDLTEADLDVLADLWPGPLTVIVPCAPGARFLPGPLVGELGGEVLTRAAGTGAQRVAGLGHEAVDHAMKNDTVVKLLANQLLDPGDMLRRQVGTHFDDHASALEFQVECIFQVRCPCCRRRPKHGESEC